MIDPRIQAMFERSRHNNFYNFIISQGYYELLKRNFRADGNIYHTFKPNIYLDVRKLYQDEKSLDKTLRDLNFLTFVCWNEKYQPLTIGLSSDE